MTNLPTKNLIEYIFQPRQNIWIIPIVTAILNLLSHKYLDVEEAWFIFGIYIAGFILIAILACIYYFDQKQKTKFDFYEGLVKRSERKPNGTERQGALAANQDITNIIKETKDI